MTGRWRDTTPDELCSMLRGVDARWALAGGHALELALPGARRDHSDIEIACFRDELPALLDQLTGFEAVVARNKQLTPYDRNALPAPPYSLWLRRPGEAQWTFEILAEDRDGDDWLYRRDDSVRRSIGSVFVTRPEVPMLLVAAEVQLLYKAKAPREKDIWDYQTYWPRLDEPAREWLQAAIARAHPEFLPQLARIAG